MKDVALNKEACFYYNSMLGMKRINALQVPLCSLVPSAEFLWSEESEKGKTVRETKRVFQ